MAKPFTRTLNEDNAPFYKWFEDGKLNVSYNCLDRNLQNGNADKTAIIFEADDGKSPRVVQRAARKSLQIRQRPESARHQEGRPRHHLHVDVGRRRGRHAGLRAHRRDPLGGVRRLLRQVAAGAHHRRRRRGRDHRRRATARRQTPAAESHRRRSAGLGGCDTIKDVIVYKRTGGNIALEGRDLWLHDLVEGQSAECEPEWVDAEHPLFILYTSGSTGTPKGVQHSSGGYLLWAALTMKWSFDIKPTTSTGARPTSAG
jgi:acetyl-CoA synthetase